ncbi:MAG TPA: L,D-transpeptidase [Candidatus Saccharimonadales bacterium]|nr:L,D-transpeptidase [Candidatus Saccharimonadales bacterium]
MTPEALRACARHRVVPTRYALAVNISQQTASLFLRSGRRFQCLKIFRCSTSKYGIGEIADSNMTPRGLHRIAQKIGGGCPAGTIFKGRQIAGFTWESKSPAAITTRIFWLEGLEPGFNRGGKLDSHARYIYIHGTGDERTLGHPASHGCVHLAAADLVPLYDLLPEGTLIWIAEK